MAWSLTVSGDVQAARGSAAHAVEERLRDDLNAVLSKPEYGVLASFLRGNHVVTTAVHVPVVPEVEPEPEPVEVVSEASGDPVDPPKSNRAPTRPGKSAKEE